MLQAHQRIGDFEIVRLLGKGGMGEVYEARQFNPERPVALKVLAPWLADDDDALQRFWREAQVPANLDHPSIVRIISTGKTDDGVAYYTMHLVRGMTLAELIRGSHTDASPATGTYASGGSKTPEQSTLPSPDAALPRPGTTAIEDATPLLQEYVQDRFTTVARIGAQAARALAYAHKKGYLHRDIKPSNMMVDQHNHVYLVDFGLTRALEGDGSGTQPGTLTGTPWYMSPEQADGKELDPRSDIYSLGVTLYELTTRGSGPFTANRKSKTEVLTQVRAGQIVPLRDMVPNIPPVLERIIERAMQRDPGQRYADAAELARDLESIGGKGDDASTAPLTQVLPSRRRWRWPVALAAAAFVLLFGAAAVLIPWRGSPEKQAPDGRNAWPEILRQAPPNTPISLLKNTHEPLWMEVLAGTGKYTTWPNHLELYSPPGDRLTMLALADPDRVNFEFAIELNWMKSFTSQLTNEIGIFFGWRRHPEDADGHHRYFILKIDETPTKEAPQGRLMVGTGNLIEQRGARAESGTWFQPLSGDKGYIPLPRSKVWHSLKLHVAEDRFTIAIGNSAVRELTVAEVREKGVIADARLGTQGAVGIWAARGRGFFRKAAVIVAPTE